MPRIVNGPILLFPISLIVAPLMFIGCAGPMTPFGAHESLTPIGLLDPGGAELTEEEGNTGIRSKTSPTEIIAHRPNIHFAPGRQNLHDRTLLRISFYDPLTIPNSSQVKAVYNGVEVTSKLLKNGNWDFNSNQTQATLTIKDLRLPPDRDHKITISYQRNDKELTVVKTFLPPSCSLYQRDLVTEPVPFSETEGILATVEEASLRRGVNPSLMTGLIAQESSFNSSAISPARALGLTQITLRAALEVRKLLPNETVWPIDRRVNSLPVPLIRTLVATNQITADDDWRLDREHSIRGGLIYLDYLVQYWQLPEMQQLISKNLKTDPQTFTRLILASYNSGPARIKQAIEKQGAHYLNDSKLKAAKKYVSRIESFCYHFANAPVLLEDHDG